MQLVSSGIKKIKQVADTKTLQLFLTNNQPKTQVYNPNTGAYTPDWTVNKPVLSAELYRAGTASNIIAQAKSISWLEDSDNYAIASGSEYTLGSGSQSLTINKNMLSEDYLKFDGSQWIDFGNKNASNAITFETWVIPTATNLNELFSKELNYKFRITDSGHIGGLASTSGTSWTASNNVWATTITPYNLYHIVGTVDLVNGTMGVYVNGTNLGQQTFTGSATPSLNGNPMNFGSFSNTGSEAFKGKFLTGRIYNRVLTAAEVTNNYNGTITTSGLVAQYLMSDGSGSTVKDSVGTANGTIHGTPRWNDTKKIITCQVTYTDTDTNQDIVTQGSIEFEQVQAGQTGPQGPAAPMATLSNDTAVVTTANDGTGGTYGAPNTQSTLTILLGTTDVTSQYTISQARNNVTVTEATTSNVATVTNMTADTGSVVFTATRSGYPTITKTFSLAKSKMGALAPSPTDYWLNSSVSNITAADDGSYTPATVTFSAESQVGTNAVTTYSGRFIIAESTDGTSFTNTYTSGADESSKVYTPSSGLAAVRVTLYQAGGTSVVLDTQTIPVINNGKNSVMLSAWTPTGNVIRNAGNTVTAEADLYNGGQPVTGTNYRWVKGNGAATSVIAGSGYEDLDLGKRNLLFNTDFKTTPSGWNGSTITVNTGTPNSAVVTKTSGNFGVFTSYKSSFTSGTTYTLSFEAKTSDVTSFNYNYIMDSVNGNVSIPAITAINDGTWHSYTLTFSAPATRPTASIMVGSTGGTSFEIRKMKAELGSTATPWQIAYDEQSDDGTMYGTNLLRNSTAFANLTYWNLSMGSGQTGLLEIVTDATKGQVIHASKTNSASWWVVENAMYNYYPAFDTTKKYSISFDIRSTNSQSFGVGIMNGDGTHQVLSTVNVSTSTSWTRKYINFTPAMSGYGHQLYLTGNIDDFYITNIKVEQVPYATDFTQAPADNPTLPNMTAGVNQWIFRYYPEVTQVTTRQIYSYSDIQALNPSYQTLLADGATIKSGDSGNYYIGYYKTAVYVSTAKTITFTGSNDDTLNIMVNGLSQYTNSPTGAFSATLSLQAGWNTIELINQEITGADGVYSTNVLSSLVEEMNCSYAQDFGPARGNYGVLGYNTSSMIVNTNAVNDTDMFMCVAAYRGATYKDSVTIDDITDPIDIVINGARLFKNGQGTNTYTAQLFQNGAEVDAAGTAYTYTWYVYNSDGSLDSSFGGSGSKTGKTITLASSDINVKGRLQCTVSQ